MRCPKCSDARSRVSETKFYKEGVRRRRECKACGHRYSTEERKVGESKKFSVEVPQVAIPGPPPVEVDGFVSINDIIRSIITQEMEKGRE